MSTKSKILNYLKDKGWVSGMEIESHALEWHSKRINRDLREMAAGRKNKQGKIVEQPSIDKSYSKDKYHAVQYRKKFDEQAFIKQAERVKEVFDNEKLFEVPVKKRRFW